MIVFTTPFVLAAEAAGASLILPRILYQNRARDLLADAVTVSGETAGGPRDAPLRPDTYEFWEPPALPATYLLNLKDTYRIDSAGLVGNFGSVRASVKVETSMDAVAWQALGLEVLPSSDAPLLFLDTARDARYMLFTFLGSVPPRVAVIYAGEALVMPRPPEQGFRPVNMARRTELRSRRSRGGQLLGRDYRRHGVEGEIEFALLDSSWYRTYFDPLDAEAGFVKSARRFPYFLAWHPQAHPREVVYVEAEDDITPTHTTFDLVSVGWRMSGIGNA